MQEVIDGKPFGYVQCDMEVPQHLRRYFSKFRPIFENTVVSQKNIGNLTEEYAEGEKIMFQPTRMLTSSSDITKRKLVTYFFCFT